MKSSIRVLVVDDSAFMRKVISDIIKSDERFEFVGSAINGQEALNMLDIVKPDVISLDIHMPVLNGLEMLVKLNALYSIPVVLISSLTKIGTKETIRGLELGAFDFITKPENIFSMKSEEMKTELLQKLYDAANYEKTRIKVSKVSLEKTETQIFNGSSEKAKKPVVLNSSIKGLTNLVVIGTSTGGPRALQSVLPLLPKDINAGIVIVQHMPPGFTKSLAQRLNQLCEITVQEAKQGDVIKPGMAFIAPGDHHLVIRKQGDEYVLDLTDGPKRGAHKPSIDVLLSSIKTIDVPFLLGIIMTGMGSDGKEGMEEIKQHRKIHTIAQDEMSSIVYGMPKAIVEAGLADEILSLDELSQAIIRLVEVQ